MRHSRFEGEGAPEGLRVWAWRVWLQVRRPQTIRFRAGRKRKGDEGRRGVGALLLLLISWTDDGPAVMRAGTSTPEQRWTKEGGTQSKCPSTSNPSAVV